MGKQFENVSNRYGAPMGRHSDVYLETMQVRSVRLFGVRLDSQGYDDGGAYWGSRLNGQHLWCAIDGDGNRVFVDACSRAQAALKLGIGALALIQAEPVHFVSYGDAILSGRAPMPEGETRASVIEWMCNSGAAMGQETHVVNGRRVPKGMFA